MLRGGATGGSLAVTFASSAVVFVGANLAPAALRHLRMSILNDAGAFDWAGLYTVVILWLALGLALERLLSAWSGDRGLARRWTLALAGVVTFALALTLSLPAVADLALISNLVFALGQALVVSGALAAHGARGERA